MTLRENAGILELLAMSDTRVSQHDKMQVSVDLVGEFDTYDLESFCEVLDGLLGSKETVCVDLSEVTFLDLGCARELAMRSDFCGGRLMLRNSSWQAVSSFRACGYGHGSLFLRPSSTPRIQTSDGRG
jgi:anti-anti-sigma regulatory factor